MGPAGYAAHHTLHTHTFHPLQTLPRLLAHGWSGGRGRHAPPPAPPVAHSPHGEARRHEEAYHLQTERDRSVLHSFRLLGW